MSASRGLAFYNYGRKRFNQRGYKHAGAINFDDCTVDGRVYVVTGANSGLGYTLTNYLYSKGGKIYMVCRNKERGTAAREQIVKENKDCNGEKLKLIICDVGLKSDVERACKEICKGEEKLDCVVCNAGALLAKKTMTKENVETTFASHFLFGTYYFGKLLLPLLEKGTDPRFVTVTSGGMYNSRLYAFNDLVSGKDYSGQLAYSKAKRAQVVLMEHWAKTGPQNIKFVAPHPGWTKTAGVDKAYGSFAQWLLSPLRTMWEGTEGIAWLCTTKNSNIKNGEVYLDAVVEPKHLVASTKSDQKDIDSFLKDLEGYFESNSAVTTDNDKNTTVV